jgi:hypothetical protein
MKNLILATGAALAAFSLSSCCCLFAGSKNSYKSTEVVRARGYDTVTKEVAVATKGSKGGMLTETVTTKVPRYKTVTKTHRVKCLRTYCPSSGPCDTTSEQITRLATAQGSTGSPHIGLVISMKPLAQ